MVHRERLERRERLEVGMARVGEIWGDVEVWGGWGFYSRNSYEFGYEEGEGVLGWVEIWGDSGVPGWGVGW
jgi:hypothetical protein